MNPVTGVIHGKTIELQAAPGIPEGQEVEVAMRVIPQPAIPGQGLLRCAGILGDVWTEEDDLILEEIQQARQQANFRDLPE